MKVLVACEFSGVVRDAFSARGHDAWSCDLLPTESEQTRAEGKHIQGDVLAILNDGWDLMIAHPPCTHLSVSGARYWKEKQANGRQQAAIDFVMRLAGALIEHIAIENPVGILSSAWRKPDQIIQPWQFGHPESKTTCLWLHGLPRLKHANVLCLPDKGYWNNQTPSGQNKLGPSPERAKIRSITYSGIARAMAEQWG